MGNEMFRKRFAALVDADGYLCEWKTRPVKIGETEFENNQGTEAKYASRQ